MPLSAKFFIRFFTIIAVLYALLLVVVYGGQRYIVFQPEKLPAHHRFVFDGDFEEHFYRAPDSTAINYLYFRAPQPSRGVVLYFHGNARHLQRWGWAAGTFTERGYDVLMPDYRGYGKSEGTPSEQLTYQDAFGLYQLLRGSWQPDQIILYGRSLGTGVATQLAARVAAKRLILETPFNSIPSLFRDQLRPVWLPFSFKYRFANDENIKKVIAPITIFHGTDDLVVPYRNAERLKPHLKKNDQFITIEKGRHRGLSEFPIFQKTVDVLLEDAFIPSTGQ